VSKRLARLFTVFNEGTDRDPHAPLLGVWLIRLTLAFGWHRHIDKGSLFVADPLFLDSDFIRYVGELLPTRVDEEGDTVVDRSALRRLGLVGIEKRLVERLSDLEAQVSPKLPLLRNTARLGRLLGLNRAEVGVLRLAVALAAFRRFHAAVAAANQPGGLDHVAVAVSAIANVPRSQVLKALRPDGTLHRAGLVRIEAAQRSGHDLETRFDVMGRLPHLLLSSHLTTEDLMAAFVRPVTHTPRCTLDDFPHLVGDAATLLALLEGALAVRAKGVNILFYGPPGTGKTEFAHALAQTLGARLVETPAQDEGGEPIQGQDRLRAYAVAASITARADRTLMLLDEAEDVLPTAPQGFLALFSGDEESAPSRGAKAWTNWLLENNPLPTLWITNDATFDPAYLRRFTFAVRFPIPPEGVRLAIARQAFAGLAASDEWLERLVRHEAASPALLTQAAQVARWVAARPATGHPLAAEVAPLAAAERALMASLALIGAPLRGRLPAATALDLAFLNLDVDPHQLVAALTRRPQATLCFYGPPGTGKTELAHWIARALDRPIVVKRASDLLSKWVGESEKAIAAMFREAHERGAVLLLDEADSFLADRRMAQAHWEVTQTNELLTQMEAFDGLFICTTNLVEQLDAASLRRFTFKVRFDYLTAAQRQELFRQEARRLGIAEEEIERGASAVRALDRLTPGDFAAAVKRLRLLGGAVRAEALVRALQEELAAKGGQRHRVGF